MAFDQDDPMALDGGDSRNPRDTLVEGYVVDHGVVWKKHHSEGACLNLDGGADGGGVHAAQPPKVSVTLSEYLSAASPHPDPSCDFGWFTPTASASSLLAGDLQEGACYPAPSPSNHPTSFLFANATRVDSGAKTASLSPESVFGGLGGGSGGDEGIGGGGGGGTGGAWAVNERAPSSAVAESGRTRVVFPNNGNRTQEPSASQREQQQQQCVGQLAPADGRGLVRRTGGGGGAGSGSDSSCGGGMGVRLLPVSRSRSTTTHLNSWHTLYSTASETGKLSSCGRCTMHIRRPSFLISTRNFPERPPTPRAWMSGRESGSTSSSSIGSTRGRGGRGGGLKVLPNGPQAGATPQQHQHQQHQADYGGGGRVGGCDAREACQRQQEQEQEQEQNGVKPKSYSWAITEIRVRKATRHFPLFASEPPFAEYLIVVCIGRERLVAGWRRASEFEKLAQVARRAWMPKACVAWQSLEQARRMHGGGPCNIPLIMRPRRLDAAYLQNKARFLEEFLKQFFFEANSKEALLSFLDTRKPATMEI